MFTTNTPSLPNQVQPSDLIDDNKPTTQHIERSDDDKETDSVKLVDESRDVLTADLTATQAIRKFPRAFLTGCLASTGAMFVGYAYTSLSNIVANRGFINQFGTKTDPKTKLTVLDAQHVAIWAAVQVAAQILAQVASPFLIDRFGRKSAMYGVVVWMVLAIILEIVGKNWKVYLAAKLFSGFASGWMGPAFMTYMSEIAMPEYRGILLSVFAFSFKIGTVTNAIACQIVNKKMPLKYLHVFYSEFVYVGVIVVAVLYLPESPIWLIRNGKEDKARKSVERIVGSVKDFDNDAYYARLVAEVEVADELARQQTTSSWKILFVQGNWKRTVAAALPFTGQQIAGIPYILNFTTYFFQAAGMADPFKGNMIVQFITLGAIFASFFLVDRVGRRPLLLVGLIGCGITNVIVGGLGYLPKHLNAKGVFVLSASNGTALISIVCIWVCFYGTSYGPLGWAALVDCSALPVRAKTAAFGVLMNSFANLVTNYGTPLLLADHSAGGAQWGQRVGLLFGGLCFVYFIPIYFLFPETKGRTFRELDELYAKRIPPRKFSQEKTSIQLVAEQKRTVGQV